MKVSIALAFLLVGGVAISTNGQPSRASKLFLHDNWKIQSAEKTIAKGDTISTSSFTPVGWYSAQVPSTVVGTLVENKIYPDPMFDQNLRQIPGCNYPIGANFSNLTMPDDSPFRSSWWYRTEFHLPVTHAGKNVWLHFDGINFRANIWLNGKQIATTDDVAGTFRVYELNITGIARTGATNTLAVEVFPQDINDLAWTFVDWNPMPPDKNMGIYRDVYVTTSGPVTVRYPQVVTNFDLPSLDVAHLTINAELSNASDAAIEGSLSCRFDRVQVTQTVKLEPRETKQVSFDPQQYQQLNVVHPKIWWPVHLGAQNDYSLETEFVSADGKSSDRQNTRFGIRQITAELDNQNHRVFKVNGHKVLIRGGGWASDMLLRYSVERIRKEFHYVKDMNLNAIRLEGQLQPDSFFELADEEGILIMAGWCCCSHWEHWAYRGDYQKGPVWEKKDYDIAAKSQTDQIKRLRSHPSLLVWLNGSDNPPPPDVEKMYIDILKQYSWPNPYLSSATAKTTTVTGESGVKMEGPYDWVPPSYWLQDTKLGGAHGFATEISPGPAVPPVESLRRMLPKDHLWPIDDRWNFHAGGGQFKTLKIFTSALENRYGAAQDLNDYALKSQLMAYEGQRAMFEGFAENRFQSSGVIQWMLNNAWPSMIWHLYDYYLMPGGGYFGTKIACEPVHVQYSYKDKSIVVVNTTHQERKGLKVTIGVYDVASKEKFSQTIDVDVPGESNIKAAVLPEIKDPTFFVKLTLADKQQTISRNFYWLSSADDILDWQKSTWYYTPTSSYADMTGLKDLPEAQLKISAIRTRQGVGRETAHVSISNPSSSLAFFIHLQIQPGRDGETVTPIIWRDNYISLLPGESRDMTATYELKHVGNQNPVLVAQGWNTARVEIPLRLRSR